MKVDSETTGSVQPSSVRYCRRLARRASSSFPIAFRLLPPAQRDAMFALYAFLRVTDDLADGPGTVAVRRNALAGWRVRLEDALTRGVYSHRVHAGLHHTVRAFGVPPRLLHDVLDGVTSDLEPVSFPSFAELHGYCTRVAAAVGLACVRVWGTRGDADCLASAAGVAFQLTNILRDLGEDRARGRVYLPRDELTRFGCPPESWYDPAPAAHEAFREMMRFQVQRAREFYAAAAPLDALLSSDGRAVYRVMAGVYSRLLDEIERRDFDVFSTRVAIGRWTMLRVYLSAWPVKWGLV